MSIRYSENEIPKLMDLARNLATFAILCQMLSKCNSFRDVEIACTFPTGSKEVSLQNELGEIFIDIARNLMTFQLPRNSDFEILL